MPDPSGPRAGFWRRLAAILIDGVLLSIVAGILGAALHSIGELLSFVLGLGYFGWLEGGPSGQTLGKRALGIRVYDFGSGGPIGFGRAVLRYFARILSALPFLLGYFWMLWDTEKQTWHDKIANSVVVPTASYPVAAVAPTPHAAPAPAPAPAPQATPTPTTTKHPRDQSRRKALTLFGFGLGGFVLTRKRSRKRALMFGVGALVLAVVLIGALSSGSHQHKPTTASSSSPIVLVTRYRPGYANTSCLQLPGSAQVRFFIYTHNTGTTPTGFAQDVQAVWLDLNGKTVDAFQNTMLAPLPTVQPHLYRMIYSDFPASGEQPIIKCWIRIGDATTKIPIHVTPAG